MAMIVVGGSGRGVGKTALVCALIAALPEFRWTAVKITSHNHGKSEPVWEETQPGHGSDTARYLAAGAERALLVAAKDADLEQRVAEVWATLELGAHMIFESNRVAHLLEMARCLALLGSAAVSVKPSFLAFLRRADALVAPVGLEFAEGLLDPAKRLFRTADPAHVSPEMAFWVRSALRS